MSQEIVNRLNGFGYKVYRETKHQVKYPDQSDKNPIRKNKISHGVITKGT